MVLSALCICLLVVYPAIIGVHLVLQKRADPDSAPDRGLQSRFKILRICANIGIITVQLISRLSRLSWRLFARHQRRDSNGALPLTQHHSQLQQKRRFRYLSGRLLGAVSLVFSLWTALRSLAPLVIQIPHGRVDIPLLTYAVSWLCAVGLLLSAVLNGFGSVSFPYTCLTPLYLEPVTSASLTSAEAELERLKTSLDDRQWQISEPGLRIQTMAASSTSSSWRGRNHSFSDIGEEVVQRRSVLANEITFLESLIDDTKDDIAEMRRAHQLSIQARTPMGRVKSWLGVLMSIVLLLRLLTAMLNMNAWPSRQQHIRLDKEESSLPGDPDMVQAPRVDLVTVILLWLMGHTSLVTTQQQLNRLSQFISLLLTAFLSVSQVNTFLRTASIVNRRLMSLCSKCYCHKKHNQHHHRPEQLSSSGLLLSTVYSYILASLAGCYFLACIVLSKLMLPETYSMSFSQSLGGVGGHDDVFWIRSYAVNAVFCLSAIVSAAVLGMLYGIQKQNTHRYSSWAATTTTRTGNNSPPDRSSFFNP